jgi:hypothetical protein
MEVDRRSARQVLIGQNIMRAALPSLARRFPEQFLKAVSSGSYTRARGYDPYVVLGAVRDAAAVLGVTTGMDRLRCPSV